MPTQWANSAAGRCTRKAMCRRRKFTNMPLQDCQLHIMKQCRRPHQGTYAEQTPPSPRLLLALAMHQRSAAKALVANIHRQRPKLGYTQTLSTRACRHMVAYTVQIIIKTIQEGKYSTNRKARIISDQTWLDRPSHDRVPYKYDEDVSTTDRTGPDLATFDADPGLRVPNRSTSAQGQPNPTQNMQFY